MEQANDKPRGKEAVTKALVCAATQLVARRGVTGVTTREIAEVAGVNQGLITRYFGTKQSLMREVARMVATQMFEQVLDRSLSLDDLLVSGATGRDETLKALAQILIDPDLAAEGLMFTELQARFGDWLRHQDGVDPAESAPLLAARVYLIASLVLGGQVVASSTRSGMKLNDEAFEALRRQAFGLVMNGFRNRS